MSKRQEYECPKCGVESHVFFAFEDPALQVILRIMEDHEKWSPRCDAEFKNLKIFPLEAHDER